MKLNQDDNHEPEGFDEGEMTFSGGVAVYAVVVALGVMGWLVYWWVWWAVG